MVKSSKTVTLQYGVYDIVYANGKQERKAMTAQQRKGLRRSKAWKDIIACDRLCELEVSVKMKF